MTVAADPDLRDRRASSLVAGVECHHARHVGLKRQHDDIVHRSQMFPESLEVNILTEP